MSYNIRPIMNCKKDKHMNAGPSYTCCDQSCTRYEYYKNLYLANSMHPPTNKERN